MSKLKISTKFLPPDLSDAGKKKAFRRMLSKGKEQDPVFNLSVNLFGKVGMVVCWYYDGGQNGAEDFEVAARLISRAPDLLAGRFSKLTEDDLFCLYDALGSFPKRDEDLDTALAVVDRVRQQRTA